MRPEQRQVLAELELTSTARAHAFVPVVSTSPPASRAPAGDDTPATYWRARFNSARTRHESQRLLGEARRELRAIRRRPFANVVYDSAEELAQRVVDEGADFPVHDVAVAMRCTPTFVRRARLAHGRDAEHGRIVELDKLEPAELVSAGMSLRQVAVVVGVPRSTLHEHLAR